jgi:hypothetical protein
MVNWKECGRERQWPKLGYYPSICLEALRKITKDFSQNNSTQEQGLKLVSEAEIPSTRPRSSVLRDRMLKRRIDVVR